MNTDTQHSQPGQTHHMSVPAGLIECLRQLRPSVQFERGPAFFLYVGAIATTIAGVVLPMTHRPGGWTVLLVSLLLWLAILAGDALVLALGTEDWREDEIPEMPAEPPKKPSLPLQVREALARAGLPPKPWQLQDSNSVELPSGEHWQVQLEKMDHGDTKG
jgi:hypothetical protein